MAAATAANDQDEDSGFPRLGDSKKPTQEFASGHDDDDDDWDGEDGEREADTQDDQDEEDEEDDGEEDEEPRLKYVRLTGSLSAVYRNGDATSCFLVAGDKMVCF